jgi:hypothetical protein
VGVRLPGLKGAERQGKRHEGDGSRDPEHRSPAIGYDGEDDIGGMSRNKGEIVQRISVLSITLGVGRTLRSPAGDLPEGERSSPSPLHLKGFKGDGFLDHRA